jgi:hypothetical protein
MAISASSFDVPDSRPPTPLLAALTFTLPGDAVAAFVPPFPFAAVGALLLQAPHSNNNAHIKLDQPAKALM